VENHFKKSILHSLFTFYKNFEVGTAKFQQTFHKIWWKECATWSYWAVPSAWESRCRPAPWVRCSRTRGRWDPRTAL